MRVRVIEKEKKKRESQRLRRKRRERKEEKKLFIHPCYSRLYIPILTVAGCKIFSGFHTWMELIFTGLVCIIAIGGVYTPSPMLML